MGDGRVSPRGRVDQTSRGSCRAAFRLASDPSARDDLLGFRFVRGQEAAGGGPEGRKKRNAKRGDERSSSGAVPKPSTSAPAIVTRRTMDKGPEWATASGEDQYGRYADVAVPPRRRSQKEPTFRMRWIEPGTFLMGSPEDEEGRVGDEGPQHEVTLTQGFWLADAPCTQAVYEAITGENPSKCKGAGHPVERVSWDDAQTFLQALTERCPGTPFTLPGEAQWEYACRAGTTEARYGEIDAIAWYRSQCQSAERIRSSRSCRMHGASMTFWVMYGSGALMSRRNDSRLLRTQNTPRVDPIAKSSNKEHSHRVVRGGSWSLDARLVRAASRFAYRREDRNDLLGFRLARGRA